MSATATSSALEVHGLARPWNRELYNYPDTAHRVFFIGLTVLCTATLYYELSVTASVSTLLLAKLHISFSFFVYTRAVASLIAAFGSLFGGIADRVGRTNLVVSGLLVTGFLVAFVIPASTSKWEFTFLSYFVFLVEGACLVATAALIRDFSPQVGRATAMGFWTSGPVVGSLIVFVVASHTIGADPSPAFWVHEYKIAGTVGLAVFVIAGIWLRELSAGLRDQLMVTIHDRALIEAKAKGIDIVAPLRNPFGQLLKADVIISSLGIAMFLLFYSTTVGFALIYFTTVFGFSVHNGNAARQLDVGVQCHRGDPLRDHLRQAAGQETRHGRRRWGGRRHVGPLPAADRPSDQLLPPGSAVGRARVLRGRCLRAVDRQLHRDRRGPQPGAGRDGSGRMGLDRPDGRFRVVSVPPAGGPLGHAAGHIWGREQGLRRGVRTPSRRH